MVQEGFGALKDKAEERRTNDCSNARACLSSRCAFVPRSNLGQDFIDVVARIQNASSRQQLDSMKPRNASANSQHGFRRLNRAIGAGTVPVSDFTSDATSPDSIAETVAFVRIGNLTSGLPLHSAAILCSILPPIAVSPYVLLASVSGRGICMRVFPFWFFRFQCR
jgi:hypothetical protein